MDIVLQLRINLAHITETLHQQTFEIRDQLNAVFDEERQALDRCLDALDHKLQECSACVDDYQRLYAKLTTMREKLIQLGATPSELPNPLPLQTVEEVIGWRIRELKESHRL